MTDPVGDDADAPVNEAPVTDARANDAPLAEPMIQTRTVSRWRTAVPMLVVMAWLVAGLILISMAHWRRGTAGIAIALVLSAGMRLFIAPEKLGPLVIRSRTFDVVFALLLAVLLIALGFGWFVSDVTADNTA